MRWLLYYHPDIHLDAFRSNADGYDLTQPANRPHLNHGSCGQSRGSGRGYGYGLGSAPGSRQTHGWSTQPLQAPTAVYRERSNSMDNAISVADYGGTNEGVPQAGGRQSQRSSSPMSSCWFLVDKVQRHLDTVSHACGAPSVGFAGRGDVTCVSSEQSGQGVARS